MRTVGQLLQTKGQDIWTISPDASVYEALEIMAEKGIGALVVVEQDAVVGIISERDYARKIDLNGQTSRNTLVRDIMTAKVITIRPDQPVETCMTLMTDYHIRHLPVMKESRLVGVISIGDVVKEVISEQHFRISQLEGYINGSTPTKP